MNKSAVEWCDFTWNVIVGCRGTCGVTAENPAGWCYARRLAPHVARQVAASTGKPICQQCFDFTPHFHEERLGQVTARQKPALIFADSMADPWSDGVKRSWRGDMLTVMGNAPQHRFVVLTKRPENITKWDIEYWPTNAWLGVSITSGADWWRWGALAKLPGHIHKFVSVEPLLGPGVEHQLEETATRPSWVILGSQSGGGAQSVEEYWQRGIRTVCRIRGIPLFEKANKRNPLPLQPLIRQMPAELAAVYRKENVEGKPCQP